MSTHTFLQSETEEIRENVSFLNHVIIGLCNKTNDVDLMVRNMMNEVRDLKCKMELSVSSPISPTSPCDSQCVTSTSFKSASSSEENLDKIHPCYATCEEVKYAANAVLKDQASS